MTPTPPPKTLKAGAEIDAWCTRCKMDLGHRIVAMVGKGPKRVLCMTCSSEHNYRAPKSAEVAKASKKTTTKAKAKPGARALAAAAAREEWEAKVRSGAPVKRYGISESFQEGEVITHKKFGDGYVEAVNSGKITVAFSDCERTLVHEVKD